MIVLASVVGLLAAAAIVALGLRAVQRRRLTAMMAISTPDGIAEQRFVRIGGVEQWIRGYWPIETRIHWVRDVTYDGDRSQIRTGTGPHVMAAVRSAAIGVLRLAGITNIAAASRHHARNAN
ncbi:MAG TPA: hypothetical protein VFG87_07325 [Amycolatopsis sp.]|nr:hypothetical protein [Amycolatopsis sp.]